MCTIILFWTNVYNLWLKICKQICIKHFFHISNLHVCFSVDDIKLLVLLVNFIYAVDPCFNVVITGECFVQTYISMLLKWEWDIFSGCSDKHAGETRLIQVTWHVCLHLFIFVYFICHMNIKCLKEKPSRYNKMRTSESFTLCFAGFFGQCITISLDHKY